MFALLQPKEVDVTTWKGVKNHVRLQLTRMTINEQTDLVHRLFLPEIYLGYVIPLGDSYTFVKKKQLEEWGIPQEMLEEAAGRNLTKTSKKVKFDTGSLGGNGAYIIIETGDGYDAARILLPIIRDKVKAILGEPFIAALPTRDFLIFWNEGLTIQAEFAEEVRKQFKEDKEYPLSPQLFRFFGDTIEVSTEEEIEE